jgi:hypothetical protein
LIANIASRLNLSKPPPQKQDKTGIISVTLTGKTHCIDHYVVDGVEISGNHGVIE